MAVSLLPPICGATRGSRATCGAVVAVPLRCRSRSVGALVVIDRAPSAVEPKLGGGVGEMLSAVLEGPALALDYALTLRRAEALSVTDDLTQLYNSRYPESGAQTRSQARVA